MDNSYFEIALLKYLYSYYNLEKAEELLYTQKIEPILNTLVFSSKISKYFRFMNKIDYSKLSFFEKRYIAKHFSNENDVERNWNQKKAISIYHKIINNIHSQPKGYIKYCYDGSIIEGVTPSFDSPNYAPNNYITFGIYYTQFDENTENDDFRNYNIIVDIANAFQENDVAVVLFSEVDMYRMTSVRF